MDAEDITRLLNATGEQRGEAMDEVFSAVYPRLRELAASNRQRWQGDLTLNTTAIVHEAYLKVATGTERRFESRGHFFAVVAKAMRQVLINYAERRGAAKRGGGAAAVTLHESDLVSERALDELLSLEDALKRLEELSPRQGRVVECLFFAGYGIAETAEALDISPATVKRDWTAARAWLFRDLQRGATHFASESD